MAINSEGMTLNKQAKCFDLVTLHPGGHFKNFSVVGETFFPFFSPFTFSVINNFNEDLLKCVLFFALRQYFATVEWM